MNAKEIMNKQFEKAKIGGYKFEEVDDFLKEVSEEFGALQKEKAELEHKLEVLADKIREYREDENALKDALLVAQKQGNAIVADSKASAEKLSKQTKESVEKLLAESKAKSEKMISDADAYSEKTRAEADAVAAKTINDANDKANEIKTAMDRQQTIQEDIIQKTRKESNEFIERVLKAFEEQIALVRSTPDRAENDFDRKIAEEAEQRAAERKKDQEARDMKAKAEAAKTAAAQQKAKDAAAKAAGGSKQAAAPKPQAKTQDVVADQKSAAAKQTGAQKAANNLAEPAEKTAENNLPFFNSDNQSVKRHENLKFGNHNKK